MSWIKTVKQQENGWLVNGNMSVPDDDNNRHCRDVKEYIRSKGYVEPQYTNEELAEKKANEAIANARKYLNDTDWYVIREMDNGVPMPKEVKTKREDARIIINKNKG